jgi:hypothetical protein
MLAPFVPESERVRVLARSNGESTYSKKKKCITNMSVLHVSEMHHIMDAKRSAQNGRRQQETAVLTENAPAEVNVEDVDAMTLSDLEAVSCVVEPVALEPNVTAAPLRVTVLLEVRKVAALETIDVSE